MDYKKQCEEIDALKRKLLKLNKDEKLFKHWLERVKVQKTKIEVESLQLGNLFDSLNLTGINSNSISLPKRVQLPPPTNSDEEVNQQELDLNVTNALSSMIEGTFYTDCEEQENEDKRNIEDDHDEDDLEDVLSSTNSKKRRKIDNSSNKHIKLV